MTLAHVISLSEVAADKTAYDATVVVVDNEAFGNEWNCKDCNLSSDGLLP